ncbi:MAG: ubiquinone/menaquinone biosynthesis methyltransferase, partial [Nitrospinae bacterium]|nr:ubiquinone/menaquinone biosynthesis methyltransferase [Nitrospinota bacterium]
MRENRVKDIFSSIAGRYDLLNEILSFRRDKHWRRVAVKTLLNGGGEKYLDMATGTADIAIEIASQSPKKVEITGLDLTYEMLALGKGKVGRLDLNDSINLAAADAHSLPFADNIFDGAIVAFGVRNFANLSVGLGEMGRTIRKGGKLVILEFSHPTAPIIKELYRLYSRHILPIIG